MPSRELGKKIEGPTKKEGKKKIRRTIFQGSQVLRAVQRKGEKVGYKGGNDAWQESIDHLHQ